MWATDGTENADRALPYAKALAREEGATLVAAHVVERYTSHKASGLAVDAATWWPQPAHEIVDITREAGVDLIAVGCRGHAAITGLMIGSVTQRLLHVSPCPVLVVPPSRVPATQHAEREFVPAADAKWPSIARISPLPGRGALSGVAHRDDSADHAHRKPAAADARGPQ